MAGQEWEIYKEIFGKARDYLLSFDKVNDNLINRHLNEWRSNKPSSMEKVQLKMLESARERQMMPNVIGDVKRLEPYFEGFNSIKICEKYEENWEELFSKMKNNSIITSYANINNPKNLWVIFCKSAISSARFLSRFSDLKQFDEFVKRFYLNEYTRVALPLLLEKEIYGFGFPLACDFLKRIGLNQFVKPDTHIKDIFHGVGISKSKADYEIFKDVIIFSETIDELPYRVDKLFWLVGSGSFYLANPPLKVRTSKKQFIKEVKGEFGQEPNDM